MYLRNAWYVAAWGHELAERPVARRLLGEDMVLFRTASGTVHALPDACPHRRLPLSMGCIEGEGLRCGYHGMLFGGSGRCLEIPGQDLIPPAAHLTGWPVAERWGLVWVWPGDPARADPAAIIEIPHYDEPCWAVNRGPAMDLACHYQLMTDNLLDPVHVSYVHASSLGNAATVGVPAETAVTADRVVVTRWMRGHDLAPFFAKRVGFPGQADRLQHYELRLPAQAVIRDIVAPAGTGAPEGQLHPATFLLDSYNFVTPVDQDNCRYHWFQVRNFRTEGAAREAESAALTADFIAAFSEDQAVLAAVHAGLKAAPSRLDLASDLGPNQARRLLARMIEAEVGRLGAVATGAGGS